MKGGYVILDCSKFGDLKDSDDNPVDVSNYYQYLWGIIKYNKTVLVENLKENNRIFASTWGQSVKSPNQTIDYFIVLVAELSGRAIHITFNPETKYAEISLVDY